MTVVAPTPSLSSGARSARARTDAEGQRRDGAREAAHRQLVRIQRARVLAAALDAVAARGAAEVSVADVVERSGVSRRTFYELFADMEACLLATFEQALDAAAQRVLPALASRRRWHERVRAALAELLCLFDEQPRLARVLVVESLSCGRRTLERRSEALALVAALLDEGRADSAAVAPPPLTAEGLVGGALAVVHARIVACEHDPLAGLVSQLTSILVLPYRGQAAARRELERPIELRTDDSRERPPLPETRDPFKEAGMRLTYRTVRVLLAIAERPRSSNRLVGEAAGIGDQGQVSRLLGRLQRAGLIANDGLAPGQGAPNAWSLTASGRELTERLRTDERGAPPHDFQPADSR